MEVKIVGTVFALPPLTNPRELLDRFIHWRYVQPVESSLQALAEAQRKLANAITAFGEAYEEALKKSEEDEDDLQNP